VPTPVKEGPPEKSSFGRTLKSSTLRKRPQSGLQKRTLYQPKSLTSISRAADPAASPTAPRAQNLKLRKQLYRPILESRAFSLHGDIVYHVDRNGREVKASAIAARKSKMLLSSDPSKV